MGTSPSALDQASLEALRRRRAELRESMSAVELALAEPSRSGLLRWAGRVHVAVVELSADILEHIRVTQGPEGLYADVLATSPRLSDAVGRLTQEHRGIGDLIEELLALTATTASQDVDWIRSLGNTLLGALVGHRQRGSDLVYEAYEFDIGGET